MMETLGPPLENTHNVRQRTEVCDDTTKCALWSCAHRFFQSNEIATVKKIAADFNASGDVTPLNP